MRIIVMFLQSRAIFVSFEPIQAKYLCVRSTNGIQIRPTLASNSRGESLVLQLGARNTVKEGGQRCRQQMYVTSHHRHQIVSSMHLATRQRLQQVGDDILRHTRNPRRPALVGKLRKRSLIKRLEKIPETTFSRKLVLNGKRGAAHSLEKDFTWIISRIC